MTTKTELLAPAGSFEILTAVLNAGADAVYAAGTRFGARAYASNFTDQELLSALELVHIKGRKLYLTVNTLLKEEEIESLYQYLCPLYEAGLDAVIVQDFGVMRFVKNHFPDLPIHASTQMTITGAYGAKFLLDQGCSRIVTARELSLEEISNIYKTTGAEIESFVHGALCYGYSGQCLLSSMIGGRSGNRGRCAQPCRLSYEVLGHLKSAASKRSQENFPLSLKDLCAIHFIPELVECGVHSFKIEGRMKQAEYAAGVTSIYRKYIDLYESGRTFQVEKTDYQILLDLGSRCGFTEGYFKNQNGRDMVTLGTPSHAKRNDGLQERMHRLYVETKNKEKINGILRLFPGEPASLVLQYKEVQAEVSGDVVQRAEKQPLLEETILEKIKKTGNTPFELQHMTLQMGENIFLPVRALNQLRRAGMKKLLDTVTDRYRRNSQIPPRQREEKFSAKKEKNRKHTSPRLSVLTETIEQFQAVLNQPEPQRIYLEAFILDRKHGFSEWKELVKQTHDAGKECYLALPYLFRMKTAAWFGQRWNYIAAAGADGYLIRNLEELSFLKEMGTELSCIQGDYGLYGTSSEAFQAMADFSLNQYTLPVELNFRELKELDCSGGEMLLYGFQPVMLSAQCLRKTMAGCDEKEGVFYLKDRYGKLFPVKNRCEDCYNIIYNISPLALFHQWENIQRLAPAGVRLSFTIENRQEIEKIFHYFRQAEEKTLDREKYLKNFTNGHFKRGVE